MNFYTLTYNDSTPTLQQLNVPTNSDYKIGIKVIGSKDAGKIVNIGGIADATILAEAFNLYPQQVTLVGDDGSSISADPELTNGYVTFTLKAGDEANFTKYKVQVKNDTFDGIQYGSVKEGTTPHGRVTTITSSISCDTPTTIYPSDKFQKVDKDGKMHPYYGNEVYFFTVKNSAGQAVSNLSYYMIPYAVEEISPKNGIRYGVRRNNWVSNAYQAEWVFGIAAEYTDEMIAGGDNLIIAYSRKVKGYYYVQFAVIPYENTFDLAINTFKSQQGDLADNISTGKTATLSGEYFDGTGFSYNIVVA